MIRGSRLARARRHAITCSAIAGTQRPDECEGRRAHADDIAGIDFSGHAEALAFEEAFDRRVEISFGRHHDWGRPRDSWTLSESDSEARQYANTPSNSPFVRFTMKAGDFRGEAPSNSPFVRFTM